MRTLYFDCFAGASGDMILGALIGAGVDQNALRKQLSLLGVDGFTVEVESVERAGLAATLVRVITQPQPAHRHLADIQKIIFESQLSPDVKNRAATIFSRLAQAEARVHNVPVDKVHFHEVGALDAIVDVVGAAVAFELLEIKRFVSSPMHVGSGTVEIEHGSFPVPPPAVAELLKNAPVYSSQIMGELVTPTGAAIITTVCSEFGPLPKMKLERTGYGAGTRTYERFPNVLRVLIGDDQAGEPAVERLWMIETNLDDLSPQIFSHVMDRAFALGALDCYFTSVHMKKNRPGVLLSILCRDTNREQLSRMLFAETTTLGVRTYEVERQALNRKIVRVETPFGQIDVKVGRLNGKVITQMPEYEQCRAAALEAKVPLREVEEAVRVALEKGSRSTDD